MKIKNILIKIRKNRLLVFFFSLHILLAVVLSDFYILAPDENGYLFTFNHIYTLPIGTSAQSASGWITAPTLFLWIALFPAKVMNFLGIPDYLSIRILSIILISICFSLIQNLQRLTKTDRIFSQKVILMTFFIPSVFLWTSLGLRESFILVELTLILIGLNYLMRNNNLKGGVLVFLGSYGLISTKIYLWVCLITALVISAMILFVLGRNREKFLKFVGLGLVLPLLTFAATTSVYALEFIFKTEISDVNVRSGDSISKIVVEVPKAESNSKTVKKQITFHGDYTLIATHFYLKEKPNSIPSKFFKAINLDSKIEEAWRDKLAVGLITQDKRVDVDTSSINRYILEPGTISNPLSLIRSGFLFLFGPFPFVSDSGIAITLASLESVLWWIFYLLVLIQFIRFRGLQVLHDPQIIFALIFLTVVITVSAIVEVNLGTSFRHRSILLIPLVFIYVRIAECGIKKGLRK